MIKQKARMLLAVLALGSERFVFPIRLWDDFEEDCCRVVLVCDKRDIA